MKSPFVGTAAAATVISGLMGAALSADSPAAQAQTTAAAKALTGNAFAHPNTNPPKGSTTFTPASPDNLFVAQMLAKAQTPQQKQAIGQYAAQINQMVEAAYTRYGYQKNDGGAAFGGFVETCWEISNGSFKTGDGTTQDQAKTRATVRQMQNALLASPAYQTTPNKDKQLLYEACTFMIGHLATQWQQAGSDETKRANVQQQARQQIQTLLGVDAASLTRRPDGTFVSRSSGGSVATSRTPGANTAKASSGRGVAPPPTAAASSGPLPPASAHGAQFFVKYVFQPTKTSFETLVLFPSGAAFSDLPEKPVSSFDEATLRATVKHFYVGTWKKSGGTLVLNFPDQRSNKVVTLRKVPKGWYDGTGALDTNNSYNTYFPVVPLTPTQLAGAWKTESLVTMGMAGGAAPLVAHGSNGRRVFNANGTFTGGSESFTSATTQNTDTANVGAYGTGSKKDGGRWRLDGPLITMESGGKRIVTPAFILPNWNKTGPPEILIDGDWWQRPDK